MELYEQLQCSAIIDELSVRITNEYSMAAVKKIKVILRDYCENTSLVGLAYISNRNIHLSERIFWLISIVLMAGGSYHLVREYQQSFESNAISLVIEDTRIQDKSSFISVGICETGNLYGTYPALVKFIKQLDEKNGEEVVDIEDFIIRIIFMNAYSQGTLRQFCEDHIDCTDCVQCPLSGYEEIAEMILLNCSELIVDCSWKGEPFRCCDYFLPLSTASGKCFVLNSLHTTTKESSNWFQGEIGWDAGDGEMMIKLSAPVNLHMLNEEDVPSYLMPHNVYQIFPYLKTDFLLRMREIINDHDVREVSPKHRKCRFPDEGFKNSTYDFYSFETCVVDCIKRVHFDNCGCNSFKMLIKNEDKTPSCDYYGFLCLDENMLLLPSTMILQPWTSFGINCECLPSCTENEIDVISKFEDEPVRKNENNIFEVKIKQSVSSERFRRQAVRSHMDVVVTIGGILGLFMGASILSGIEIIYFFFIRIFYSNK